MQLAQPVMHFFHLYLCIFMNSEMSFLDSSVGKESACNVGDPGSIPGSRRSPGEGIGYTLQTTTVFEIRYQKNPISLFTFQTIICLHLLHWNSSSQMTSYLCNSNDNFSFLIHSTSLYHPILLKQTFQIVLESRITRFFKTNEISKHPTQNNFILLFFLKIKYA